MANELESTLDKMSLAIRSIAEQISSLEQEIERLKENVSDTRCFNRNLFSQDVGEMASIFMESISIFEHAARAAIDARSNAKRLRTESFSSTKTDPELSPPLVQLQRCCSDEHHPPASCNRQNSLNENGSSTKSVPNKAPAETTLRPVKTRNEFNTARCGVAPSELRGRDCSQCCDFYKHVGIGHATSHCENSLIDAVSRHRSSRKRTDTPEGYWDIQFPDTQDNLPS